METVTLTREIPVPPGRLREAILDVESFMETAGFDTVEVRGDVIRISNTVSLLLTIELTLEVVDRGDAVLAYRQTDGMFREMMTEFFVHGHDEESTVTVTTEFDLGLGVAGPILDATLIKHQRRVELNNQLDYLESLA